MPTLRRLVASLSTALLLLQSLQGVDRSCMELASHAPAPVAAHGGTHRADAAVTDPATSTHDEAAPTAATLATAPGASDDGAHGCCPERDETRSCATMTGCLLPVALPVQDAPSGTAQVDRVIVAARLGIPAIVSFSPELPPPRA